MIFTLKTLRFSNKTTRFDRKYEALLLILVICTILTKSVGGIPTPPSPNEDKDSPPRRQRLPNIHISSQNTDPTNISIIRTGGSVTASQQPRRPASNLSPHGYPVSMTTTSSPPEPQTGFQSLVQAQRSQPQARHASTYAGALISNPSATSASRRISAGHGASAGSGPQSAHAPLYFHHPSHPNAMQQQQQQRVNNNRPQPAQNLQQGSGNINTGYSSKDTPSTLPSGCPFSPHYQRPTSFEMTRPLSPLHLPPHPYLSPITNCWNRNRPQVHYGEDRGRPQRRTYRQVLGGSRPQHMSPKEHQKSPQSQEHLAWTRLMSDLFDSQLNLDDGDDSWTKSVETENSWISGKHDENLGTDENVSGRESRKRTSQQRSEEEREGDQEEGSGDYAPENLDLVDPDAHLKRMRDFYKQMIQDENRLQELEEQRKRHRRSADKGDDYDDFTSKYTPLQDPSDDA